MTITPFNMLDLTPTELTALEAHCGGFDIVACKGEHGDFIMVRGDRVWLDFLNLAEMQQAIAAGTLASYGLPF